MTDSPEDRRKHTRVPTDLKFSFFIKDQEYIGKVGNVSLSGAFLSRPEPELTPTHTLQSGDLKIQLNGELLVFKCEIVYVVRHDNEFFPMGVGVVFNETDVGTCLSVMKLASIFKLY